MPQLPFQPLMQEVVHRLIALLITLEDDIHEVGNRDFCKLIIG
jgi:hypothetical protein